MKSSIFLFILFITLSCSIRNNHRLDAGDELNYCHEKLVTFDYILAEEQYPVYIPQGDSIWSSKDSYNWTSGFWPGLLWYAYEYSQNEELKKKAESYTIPLEKILFNPVKSHDLGFIFNCSFGNAYRLTGESRYKDVIMIAADSLSNLYNPKVGTILSWPKKVKDQTYYPHNTIIDNMMNLELLFLASQISGDSSYYHIANNHALTTMRNHIRNDSTTWHVLIYDDITSNVLAKKTHQGYSDQSLWARGQAWGIYGFTVAYRETGYREFLTTAQKLLAAYIKRLPADYVPYWDFDDPAIPDAPRDASSAAITSSALLALFTLVKNPELSNNYYQMAEKMLSSLSSNNYKSPDWTHSFLMHSTGNKPRNTEVDVPIIYADYYYLEALLRLNKFKTFKSF